VQRRAGCPIIAEDQTASLAGTDDTYAVELGNIRIGYGAFAAPNRRLGAGLHRLHYWLRLAGRIQPVLLARAGD